MSAKTVTRTEFERLCGEVETLAADLSTLRTTWKRAKILQQARAEAIAADKSRDVHELYQAKMTLKAAERWRKQTARKLKLHGVTAKAFAEAIGVRPKTFLSYLYGRKHRVPVYVSQQSDNLFTELAQKPEKSTKR